MNLKLVSDGAVMHVFDSPGDVVNDGRWYVHEHETDVPKRALTYARFEAWFDVPGLAGLLWRPRVAPAAGQVAPSPRAGDRDARARIRPRARHAQHVERAAERP